MQKIFPLSEKKKGKGGGKERERRGKRERWNNIKNAKNGLRSNVTKKMKITNEKLISYATLKRFCICLECF